MLPSELLLWRLGENTLKDLLAAAAIFLGIFLVLRLTGRMLFRKLSSKVPTRL